MSAIHFDVLVPRGQAQPLGEVFATAGAKLHAARHADAVETSRTELDAAGPLAKELSRVYEDEHDGRALEDLSLQRYTLSLRGFGGSLNQLAMALSRLLTPPAQLPDDRVLRENERSFEVPALYPWTVAIER